MDSKQAAEILRKERDSSKRAAIKWERMRTRGASITSPEVCLALEAAHTGRIEAMELGAEALEVMEWLIEHGIGDGEQSFNSIDDIRAARKERG